jgi:hypothetical protein
MARRNSLLLVIPSVVLDHNGSLRVEADFLNDLRVYCKNFDEVIFACPALNAKQNEGYIQRSALLDELPDNAQYIRLPYTYREDTHLSHYFMTRKLLGDLVEGADYLLFAPHAPLDWPTLAAREAFKMGPGIELPYSLWLRRGRDAVSNLLTQCSAGGPYQKKYVGRAAEPQDLRHLFRRAMRVAR